MPRQIRRTATPEGVHPNAAALEATREALIRRLDHLGPGVKRAAGYKSALSLLNQKFRLATLSSRAGILQAASFMIDVLEGTLPLL